MQKAQLQGSSQGVNEAYVFLAPGHKQGIENAMHGGGQHHPLHKQSLLAAPDSPILFSYNPKPRHGAVDPAFSFISYSDIAFLQKTSVMGFWHRRIEGMGASSRKASVLCVCQSPKATQKGPGKLQVYGSPKAFTSFCNLYALQ